jgi:hypothetical protein
MQSIQLQASPGPSKRGVPGSGKTISRSAFEIEEGSIGMAPIGDFIDHILLQAWRRWQINFFSLFAAIRVFNLRHIFVIIDRRTELAGRQESQRIRAQRRWTERSGVNRR